MKKHINVPIFIPHIGCPNGCVFCNQRKISGKTGFSFHRVKEELDEAFSTVNERVSAQIAYFGGSFTGIDREDMKKLLEIANEYMDAGKCESIRISTRPDYISPEILEILRAYRVSVVELGIQSTDDAVLRASRRGHTAEDSRKACELLLRYGFDFVGQMMVGLPFSDAEKERKTAMDIADMGACGARIYPTVVFEETELAEMLKNGLYAPLTTEESVARAANALAVFMEREIPVIRIGLHSSEALSKGEGILAGGYHPAVGERAYSRYFRSLLEKEWAQKDLSHRFVRLWAHPSDVSKWIGQRGENKIYLMERYGLSGFQVIPKDDIPKNQYQISLSL